MSTQFRLERRLGHPGYVYFVAVDDDEFELVKVGYASDPIARASALQTGSPLNLVLIGYAQGSRAQEAELHAQFSEQKTRGEWFRYDGDLRSFLHEMFFELYEEAIVWPLEQDEPGCYARLGEPDEEITFEEIRELAHALGPVQEYINWATPA